MNLLPPALQPVDRTFVLFRGKRYAHFGGCDYFRLATHPRVVRAFREAAARYGLNVAASRRTSGNHPLYRDLERALERYFGVEAALLVSSGYAANLVVGQALRGRFSHVLIDTRAHASLWDAASWLGGRVVPYRHRDAEVLGRAAVGCGKRARLVVLTDGLFGHDGSAAPLFEYRSVLPADAWLLVDDAHGAGVVGRRGRGTPEWAGLSGDRLIQTVTLSKAFGVYGGAVLGSPSLIEAVIAKSRFFIGNTPVPLPCAAAALVSIDLVRNDARLRERLRENCEYVKGMLRQSGIDPAPAPGPIISVAPDGPASRRRIERRLLARGILPPFMRYPGGPRRGHFRFAISSEHRPEQLQALVSALVVQSVGWTTHSRSWVQSRWGEAPAEP